MRNLKGFSATGPFWPAVLLAAKGVPFMPCMKCDGDVDVDGMDEMCVDVCVDVCVDDVCVGGMVSGTDTSRLAAVSGGRAATAAARGMRGVVAPTPCPIRNLDICADAGACVGSRIRCTVDGDAGAGGGSSREEEEEEEEEEAEEEEGIWTFVMKLNGDSATVALAWAAGVYVEAACAMGVRGGGRSLSRS
jgi:hypothetical protein